MFKGLTPLVDRGMAQKCVTLKFFEVHFTWGMGYELRPFRFPYIMGNLRTQCRATLKQIRPWYVLHSSNPFKKRQAASSVCAWYTYSNRAYTQPFTAAFRWSWKPTKWLGIWKGGWLRKERITELSFWPSWCLVIFETGRRPTRGVEHQPVTQGGWNMVVCFRFPLNFTGMSSKVSKLCVSPECHCEGLVSWWFRILRTFCGSIQFFLAILQVNFSGWWP